MRLLLLVFALLALQPAGAQDTLSNGDFHRLAYDLPADLRADDSAALVLQFRSVAPRLQADVAPFLRKPLRDSGLLAEVMTAAVIARLYGDDPDGAIRLIDSARQYLYKQRFALPTLFLERAYAEALRAQRRGGAFADAFADALYAGLQLIEPAFRKDVSATLKARYLPESGAKLGATARSFVESSLKARTPMEIYNMPYVMQLFLQRHLIGTYGNRMQEVLRRVSPEAVLQTSVQIPMRDGVRLHGLLFRDSAALGPVPVVIMQSPYPTGNEGRSGNIYAVNGYAMLYVDCRGRGKSEGTFFPYENDARDYYDIIDWAVKQPWCNGKAATSGGSYVGFTQWQAIRTEYRHPALKAINPMVSVGFGVDFPRISGSFYPYILRWATYVQGATLNSALFENNHFWQQKEWEWYRNRIPFARFDSVAGLSSPYFTRWLQHPDFDEYWRNILPKEADYRALDIPVLTTTGYYDGDQLGALHYYGQHLQHRPKSPHYLIIGPFDHSGAQWMPAASQAGRLIDREAQIPLYKYVIGWFDWALKGTPLPAFFRDKAMYYDPAGRNWKGAPSLFRSTGDSLRLHLSAPAAATGATLLPARGRDSSFAYTHDLFSVRDSASFFAPAYDSAWYAFNPGLRFESAPLDRDYVLTGACTAQLLAAISTPDADLHVNWILVHPSGKLDVLADDALRLRYRRGDGRAVLMRPGVPDLLPFRTAFYNVQHLPKGARLRLEVRLRNDAGTEKNWGFGGVVSEERATGPRPIELRVFARGSSVAIPVQ
ncbi:CocE/NonD family hydrolase [Flaviaesturariibacter amylovorans]|uniref:Xaa-Pro dipeptidyl-peptidase C-terminal domain-containing protein n=1 Tax=Flaviaesturariibacter amylovorans TaxID=1084520 RepID=A0ABP8HQ45_9BACT